MSTDKRARLVQFIEESVYKFTEAETATLIVNDIIKILNDFEISDRCTDIVVYDDQNDRIIKRYVTKDGIRKLKEVLNDERIFQKTNRKNIDAERTGRTEHQGNQKSSRKRKQIIIQALIAPF